MPWGAGAQEPDTLASCARIGAPADRLACYDRLAGRAPVAPTPVPAEPVAPPTAPPLAATTGAETPPPTTSLLAPAGVAPPETREPGGAGTLLSQYWELDPRDKRGTFFFTGYRPNYVMPLHLTSRINRRPQSPTREQVELPNYREVEAKYQLSLRTKVVEGLLLPDADLWLGFTHQALWQLWNGTDSKPFRNSDYEPEAIWVVPTPPGLRPLPAGWQWRYVQLGLAHQSNGQSKPLSRSWNRVYLATGFERGDWTAGARWLYRLSESGQSDDNPDLLSWRGRGEFNFNWSPGAATASLQWRTSLANLDDGALQFEWTYPVDGRQPNGLRWFVQLFHGYGETLTDYNFRQTSVGVGLTFLQF